MRILTIHADFIEFRPLTKAIKAAEDVAVEKRRIEDCLVVFTAIEAGDTKEVIDQTKIEVANVAHQVRAKRIVIYPFVHLTSSPAKPEIALSYLRELEKISGYEVTRAPFGWYKEFNIKCKGHPLAELSREIKPKERKIVGAIDFRAPAYSERKHEYLVLTPDGKEYDAAKFLEEKIKISKNFRIVVEKEGLKKGLLTEMVVPEYIKICKKYGIDWEEMSDIGHMRYAPNGALIFDLVVDYSDKVVTSLGIPVLFVRGSNMYDLSRKEISQHAQLFGDRLYTIRTEDKECVLRYASCHAQFAMMRNWIISHNQLPFGVYEVADSYRFEQSGESLLCFRARRFYMPDLHIFCKNQEEASAWMVKVQNRIFEEAKKFGRDYEMVINVSSPVEYTKNKELILQLLSAAKKSALINIYPGDKEYYWTVHVDYNIIDDLGRPREIATTQIDTGNARRFEITYIDENGKKKYPVILHNAITSTVERWIYMIFDTAIQTKRKTGLIQIPLWLNPEQVRILPIANRHIAKATEIADAIEREGIRVGIDDRNATISRKVRDAKMDWVNYVVVVGDRELSVEELPVYIRRENKNAQLTLPQLIKEILKELGDAPRRRIYVPREMTKRPLW